MTQIFTGILILHPWASKRPPGTSSHIDAHFQSFSFLQHVYYEIHVLRRKKFDKLIFRPVYAIDRCDLQTSYSRLLISLHFGRDPFLGQSIALPPPPSPGFRFQCGGGPAWSRLQLVNGRATTQKKQSCADN